jgi:gliding motility-associated-like protein
LKFSIFFNFLIIKIVKITSLKIPNILHFWLGLMAIFFANKAVSQIEFIENKGQWNSQVKFMSNAGNGAIFLQKRGFTILQHNQQELEQVIGKLHVNKNQPQISRVLNSHAYNVEFVNATASPEIIPDKALPSVNNYFIGKDSTRWARDCKIYKGITYKNMYPGIDVRFYTDAGERLKYDLIVHPGANINNIALKYKGADRLSVKNKELLISTSVGQNKELYPYTYQVVNNQRKELDCKYVVDKDIVKFKVKNYTRDQVLIIDPTEIFFTYSGSISDNWGFTATYGPDGSFFGGGIVFGNEFPASPGAFKTTFNSGKTDIAIIKLSPNGVNRIYATYIGGNGEEQPHSLFADAQGNLVVAGRSNSSNYPILPSPNNGSVGKGGGWDVIVTKLNAAGNGLIGSLKIGGTSNDGVNISDNEQSGTSSLKRNYGDDARSEVIIDGTGNIYLASCTQSTGSDVNDRFPVTAGVFQPNPGKGQDAVVLKINPSCTSILWSSFLGGEQNDAAYVLTLGNNNNLYVAGGTKSDTIKAISSRGVISSVNSKGDCDGFVVELTNDGRTAVKGTYLGTPAADEVYGIQTDKLGFIYVMGTTEGSWPVLNAAFVNANGKQFISKIKPDLSAYVYSTTFGSGSSFPNISPTAFLVDRCENVYVSGWGGKANSGLKYNNGSTHGLPVTADAIKSVTDASGSDFYFFVLKKDAASQLYGTFFGQEDPVGNNNSTTFGDHVDGGTSRFDKNGIIYQAICGNCYRKVVFNGTPGTWSVTNRAVNGGECNLGMVKIEMDFAGVAAAPRASINGVPHDTVGCIPLTVDFADTLQEGKRYIWDFGDGSPKVNTTDFNIAHTYMAVGKYRVMLVSIDSSTCNVADTAYLTIRAGNNKALLDFSPNKLPPCTNLSYRFDNTSNSFLNNFGPQSFTWDFGDGTAPLMTGTQSVTHTYAGPGTYQVKLTLEDTSFCNSPDDTVKTVRLSPNLKAQFNSPATGCVPYNAVFENTSLGGLNFIWDFGDGTTSTVDNPSHFYANVGTYAVKLYTFDSSSCNKTDSAIKTISVLPIPVAAFIYNPTVPSENTFTDFSNQTIGAVKYSWDFGDGETSIEENPSHIFPATGTYNICLTVENEAGCADTTCQPVQSLIKPLIDVPNAFTPGKFGINSVVKVQGFGIQEMHWAIYNRWGQKVFETNNHKTGWDGTFKGKLQPLDVYAYTLDVTFSDGRKYRKTGDITLLK